MKRVKIFRFLVIVVAIIGCCYQILTLTDEYMRMEVMQDLEMVSSENVQIPDITFNTYAFNLIDYSKLRKQYPEKAKQLNETYAIHGDNFMESLRNAFHLAAIRDVLTTNFTTRDYLNVIYDIDKFMEVAILPSPNDGFEVKNRSFIRNACKTIPYLKGLGVYLTTSCYSKDVNRFIAEEVLQNSLALIGVALSPTILGALLYLEVYLHSPKTMIRGLRSNAIYISPSKEAKTYALSYKRSYSQLLPAPFETNCRNYSKEGFESRQHAIEECQNKLSMKQLGVVFPENIRLLNINAFPTEEQKNSLKRNETMRRIRSECMEENVEPDCIQEVFVPKLYPGIKLPLNVALIAVVITGELDVIKTSRPKTSFVEYITLATSVVGFWFGFSITGSLIIALSIASNKELMKQLRTKSSKILKKSAKSKVSVSATEIESGDNNS